MALVQTRTGKIRKNIVALLLTFCLLIPGIAVADVSLTLYLGPKKATINDTINMTLTVSGSRKTPNPFINGLDSFHVFEGGSSSQVKIINGQYTSSIKYLYSLNPKKEGTFRIGPAEVIIKGKRYKSNIETLNIVASLQLKGPKRGKLFLNANLSSSMAYVEEQLIYTLKLYRQIRVSDVSLELPGNEQLVFKQLGDTNEYQKVYNGQDYQVLEVNYSIIPKAPGTYGIKPSRMRMKIFENRGTPYGFLNDPFFSMSTGQSRLVSSEPQDLQVLPLPERGCPANFSGLVGRFKIKAGLTPSTIKVGESATLTVQTTGHGNIKQIPDIQFPGIEDIKVYADQPVLNQTFDNKGQKGSKIMKWALVPEKEGHFKIPRLTLSFFDTSKEKYIIMKTDPLDLKVLGGQIQDDKISINLSHKAQDATSKKHTIKELGHDILPIYTSIKGIQFDIPLRPRGLMIWIFLISPVILYMGFFLAMKQRQKASKATGLNQARKAARIFAKRCGQEGLRANDLILYCRDYLNDRMGLRLGSLTALEAARILLLKGVTRQTTDQFFQQLKVMEAAIYSGRDDRMIFKTKDLIKIVKKIDKELR